MDNIRFYFVSGLREGSGQGRHNACIIREAVHNSLAEGYTGLSLPSGTYEITDDKALDLWDMLLDGRIRADDYSRWKAEKNTLIDIKGVDCFTIDGGGATLLFDGLMQAVDFTGSRNIRIENLTIDWIRTPYITGTITKTEGNWITIAPSAGYSVSGGEPVVSLQNVDPDTRRPGGICLFSGISNITRLEDGRFTVECEEPEQLRPGMFLVLRYLYSYAPVLHFMQCSNIHIHQVTLHAGPGMGIIAHECRDISLQKIRVLPQTGRPMSVNCDATHFISCSGTIRFEDCFFEGMGDDATNVHGFYLLAKEKHAADTISVQLEVTTQDFLPEIPTVGDRMELVHPDTLLPYACTEVAEVTVEESGRIRLRFTSALPDGFALGDAVANLSRIARLEFLRCRVQNIRGRAVLIQTRSAQVRECVFEHCTGQGIHIDTAVGWWESLGTRDIEIANNQFVDCGYGSTKYCDAVGVVVETECPVPAVGVHRNIQIVNNTIVGEAAGIVLRCAENITVAHNSFSRCCIPVKIGHTSHVTLLDNHPSAVWIDENCSECIVNPSSGRRIPNLPS